MQSPSINPKAVPHRPRRSMLNWVDFLVIVATVLVFAAVVAANNHRARAESRSATDLVTNLPQQASQGPDELGLIKARIRLANGGPWT